MAQRIVIVDSTHPLCQENRCFDPAVEYTGCGHTLNVRLAREGQRRGIGVATADVYLAMAAPPRRVACLTDMVTPRTERLLDMSVIPAVL